MRVGVVGAGLSGLAAARSLVAAGHQVVVLEKSPGFGGRLATRRVNGFTFDTGATNLTPRSSRLADLMLHELPTENLIRIQRPIWFHENFRVSQGSALANRDDRYTYRQGMTELPKLLASGLDVRLNQQVQSLEIATDGIKMHGLKFDAVILAMPMPQAEMLLHSTGEHRRMDGVRFRSCLSVLLGFAEDIPESPFFSLLDVEQACPLTWLTIENRKVPERAPAGHTAVVAQMSAAYSEMHFNAGDANVLRDALLYTRRLLGPHLGEPIVAQVKRWKYSQPELTTSFARANPVYSRIVVAGDALLGGRAELAFDSGLMAAQHILNL